MFLVVCLNQKVRHLIDRWARPENGYRDDLVKDMEKVRAGVYLMSETRIISILLWRRMMLKGDLRVFRVEELNEDQVEDIIDSFPQRRRAR